MSSTTTLRLWTNAKDSVGKKMFPFKTSFEWLKQCFPHLKTMSATVHHTLKWQTGENLRGKHMQTFLKNVTAVFSAQSLIRLLKVGAGLVYLKHNIYISVFRTNKYFHMSQRRRSIGTIKRVTKTADYSMWSMLWRQFEKLMNCHKKSQTKPNFLIRFYRNSDFVVEVLQRRLRVCYQLSD